MKKNILAIEASSALCSVALSCRGQVQIRESDDKRAHSEHLLAYIRELLAQAGSQVGDLDAIVFSKGPGSFTGVRLAASVAKSLAYAANIPVIGISSLMAMAAIYWAEPAAQKRCLVAIDARMNEYYVAEFEQDNGIVRYLQEDQLVDSQGFQQLAYCSEVMLTDGSDWLKQSTIQLPQIAVRANAQALLDLVDRQWSSLTQESALDAQVNYLRNKSAWKNVQQQNNNPVNHNR